MLVFMAANAYLAVNHLRQAQTMAALTLKSSVIQADIQNVLGDLTDMETGQRGYLLTGNPSYLQPYNDAKGRIANDFAALRAGSARLADGERALEPELESLVNSKQSEMERSINLRQQGYRHRAFMLVDTNEGMEYMDRARAILSSLSAAEVSNFARFERDRDARLRKALAETIFLNSGVILLTACLFWLIHYEWQVLDRRAIQSRQELAVHGLQLKKLTSALSTRARSKTSAIEVNARLLLQNYGGFLPLQGHKCAEQIKEASAEMELLRQELVGTPESDKRENAEYQSVA